MKLDYILVGFPKCGTSTVAYYLNTHNSIFCNYGEPGYWFNPDISTKRIEYENNMKSDKDVVGEKTPGYIQPPSAIT